MNSAKGLSSGFGAGAAFSATGLAGAALGVAALGVAGLGVTELGAESVTALELLKAN
jgi:hypothetical protein